MNPTATRPLNASCISQRAASGERLGGGAGNRLGPLSDAAVNGLEVLRNVIITQETGTKNAA